MDMEMEITRKISIEKIKMSAYEPARWGADGGTPEYLPSCEEYEAYWVDIIGSVLEKKIITTPLTEIELEIFDNEICEFVNENYEEPERDGDAERDRKEDR